MKFFLIAMLLSSAHVVLSESLPVVESSADTISTAPYRALLPTGNALQSFMKVSPSTMQQMSQPPAALSFTPALPQTAMTVGDVTKQSINLPWLTMPVFLIGDDEVSRHWLIMHYHDLVAMHAQGLIINASSQANIDSLQAAFPEGVLLPVSGDVIAQRLSLHHYPVLITKTEILP